MKRDHKLIENLMADSRRAVIQPLRDQMRTAVAKRWRKQLTNVRRALKTHTATDWLTAAAVVATAIPFRDAVFSKKYVKVKTAAYESGVDHASVQLGVEVNGAVQGIESAPEGWIGPYVDWGAGTKTWRGPNGETFTMQEAQRTARLTTANEATNLEDELDDTTVDRAHNALKALDPFTLSAATAALGVLFKGFTDPGTDKLSRADTVALHTVSDGYHAGASDTAAQAVANGIDVEKAWVTEDDPCPTCEANEAEGYIPEDAPHDSGDFEPPQHPNCACSETYRVAEPDEADSD